jgi:hypothetical protein
VYLLACIPWHLLALSYISLEGAQRYHIFSNSFFSHKSQLSKILVCVAFASDLRFEEIREWASSVLRFLEIRFEICRSTFHRVRICP